MNDQTFHTPSFGDEEFDISAIHTQHAPNNMQVTHLAYAHAQAHHPAPQVGMINPAQDGLSPPGGAPSYQQPLYLQEPHTPVTSVSAGAPAGNYIIQQQPGGQQRLLMMQPTQTMSGPPTPSSPTQTTIPQMYGRSPQRASPPGTTSDDSDDSVPSQHSQLPGDAESLLPIHYCSASRQQQASLHQLGMANNTGVKRSSPEPMDNGISRGQVQKKPKVQKKKKKRDPNEPQKPVSAYALFFRDTQAAIKGQNPNASFGEVSKIVASMWDGLDSEHKSVYKQKTEVAKKEYLKALAAYRASLVSKGGEQENQVMYNHTNNTTNTNYGGYYQGQNYGNGHTPQNYVPTSVPQGYTPQNYPTTQPTNYVPGQPTAAYQQNTQQQQHQSQQQQHQSQQQQHQAQQQHYPQGPPTHSPQSYQALPSQPQQNYQDNTGNSPQNYQGNVAQSPRGYQGAQSPQNYGAANISPQNYRTQQSPTSNIAPSHPMQYHHHHPQQVQQVHQYQAPSQPQPPPAQIEQHSPISNNNNTPNSTGCQQSTECDKATPSCIRQGCTNPAISNSEWEDEYCSNECVVSHCRDVFTSWVASNTNSIQNFSAVK